MRQTLRRELRLKFEEVLHKGALWTREKLAEELADAALSLRAFQFQPQTIEQAIFTGVPVTEEMAERENLRDLAPKMFERALGFSKPLPWWTGRDWDAFGEWVCQRYAESKTSFGEYNVWRNTPYTKGGMSNNRIRGFINEFYDSWDMFMMSGAKKTDEERPAYNPVPERVGVPRPAHIPPPNIKRSKDDSANS